MNLRFLIPLLSLLLLTFTACQEEAHVEPGPTIYDQTPVQVSTKKSGMEVDGATTVLSGAIQSKDKAMASARMMGYVASLSVDIGDNVRAGQVLIRIEDNELPAKQAQAAAGVAEAKAGLKNVKLNYDRLKVLWEEQSVTRREWDDITSQYEMMQAKVEGARQMKREIDEVTSRMIVKAPISGVVTSKRISLGDLVNPGVPLLTVEGNKGYEVVTYVSDHQVNSIKKGMQLDCTIDALGETFKAVVSEISPSASATGGQFAIKAALKLSPAQKKVVYPGMYAHVKVPIAKSASSANYATVAKSAIIERGQLKGVYTVSNQNTALLRWIRTGRDFGDQFEVVSGLALGEDYIVSDLSSIKDGYPVAVKK